METSAGREICASFLGIVAQREGVKSVVTPIAAVFHIDTIELMIARKSSVT
jgi:hypothetical protein